MRLVADTPDDYRTLSFMQKQITQLFKIEKENNPDGPLVKEYRKLMNAPLEKSYERPGSSVSGINQKRVMETDDRALLIAYIVQSATQRKKAAIEYRDAKNNVSKRLIEPHSWRNDQVIAWCHERNAWRQFKPSQIVRIAITNEDFDRSEKVEITLKDAKTMAYLAV